MKNGYGHELKQLENGFYKDDYYDTLYNIVDGKAIPLISDLEGSNLYVDEQGNLKSEFSSHDYKLVNGVAQGMKDIYCGGELIKEEGNKYTSQYTGLPFMFDEETNRTIPLYIPDDTLEQATYENGVLIGKDSKRVFEIDENGRVLTEEQLRINEEQKRDMDIINQMKEEGTIDEYIENINQKVGVKEIDLGYSEYIKKINKLYSEEKGIISTFDFDYSESPMCHHNIEINGQKIMGESFKVDNFFVEFGLNKMVNNYGLRNRKLNERVEETKYIAVSENSNAIIFNNISKENIEYLQGRINTITPVILEQNEKREYTR